MTKISLSVVQPKHPESKKLVLYEGNSYCEYLKYIFFVLLISFVCIYYGVKTIALQNDENSFMNFRAADNEARRYFVKGMARDAWKAYAQYSWGQDALQPLTKTANQEWLGPNGGLTLIQSMSTLYIMGFQHEYRRAKQWMERHFNFSSINQPVNVFVVVTEVIGSLLSNYALTGDRIFLSKAHKIARHLAPAYDTVEGLSYKKFNPTNDTPSGEEVWLGEAGGQWLEYRYLANATGDREIGDRNDRIREFFQRVNKPKGLYLASLDATNGEWTTDSSTLFAPGSTFFSYLMKSFVQSGGKDLEILQTYLDAVSAVERNLLIHNSPGGVVYVRDHNTWTGEYGEYMRHDSCYLGAMLALGADAQRSARYVNTNFSEARWQQQRAVHHFRIAQNITETCHLASVMSHNTGLPPAHLFFREIEATPDISYNRFYLTSELAESYFILWRMTHDNKYREYAWKLVESLWRHAQVKGGGYSNINDVDEIPTVKTNYQPPQFLGATLKYLYLIFEEDDVLPLDKWVFNRVGQPLPICGHNDMLDARRCV